MVDGELRPTFREEVLDLIERCEVSNLGIGRITTESCLIDDCATMLRNLIAEPRELDELEAIHGETLSLRDRFAGQAITALLNAGEIICLDPKAKGEDALADAAYRIADAMVRRREVT